MTFKQDILNEAGDESIEAIVIGEMGWGDYGSDGVPNYAAIPKNVVLSWADSQAFLDYDYDAGYGAPRCNKITAWTPTRVIFVSQYDGSTALESVPRNPCNHEPSMPGG